MSWEIKVLYTYATFLFTLIFFMGLGAVQIFVRDINITIPEPPRSIFDLPGWFISNILLFFSLLFIPAVDPSLRFLVAIIISPILIIIIYIIIKLIVEALPF